ncbi:MAG TPA: hypothetical protein DEQ44_01480 [Flavobacteriaceae bacterium]|nr:hypothetical protein [Flavobacteriaceae bacterium]
MYSIVPKYCLTKIHHCFGFTINISFGARGIEMTKICQLVMFLIMAQTLLLKEQSHLIQLL